MEEVTIIPYVTTNSNSNSRTDNLSFLAQLKDIKEWVAPESNNTDNCVPRIEQIPLIRLSDCEALAPLIAITLPAAFGFFYYYFVVLAALRQNLELPIGHDSLLLHGHTCDIYHMSRLTLDEGKI